MEAKRRVGLYQQAFATVILFSGLLATWLAYAPGLSGSLQFDDHHNLSGLTNVEDPTTAFRFIATGYAGPLGRPLALASFVPQAYAWPSEPEVFLRTNILIHMLNGILVTWFLYLLGQARGQREVQAASIAVAAGAIWMLMPLLASSSLFVVQRMTTLSAVLTLLGAVGYMYSRRAADRHPTLALCGMAFSIGIGASLAALAKENGILLCLFILAAEATVLHRPSSISVTMWRWWFNTFLVAPFAVLVVYMAVHLPYTDDLVLRRNFTGFERLITQAGILWKYLYLAFIPHIPNLGPFHDDYPIQRSLLDVATLFAVAGWLVAISAAVALRRKAPLFAFAVAWYLLGHILESTTFSLELYFEHRNYLPLIGPLYALVSSLAEVRWEWRRLAMIGGIVYAGLIGGILSSVASLWGAPPVAAEIWHIQNPTSLRAAQNLAVVMEKQGDPYSARKVLSRYAEHNPTEHAVRLQVLAISCQLEPEIDHKESIRVLERALPSTKFSHSTVIAFQQLYAVVREVPCLGVGSQAIYSLGHKLLENNRFNLPIVRHNVHAVMARICIDERNFDCAMSHIEAALSSHHNTDTLLLAIGVLSSGGRNDVSWGLLAQAEERRPPRHPLRALQWRRDLDRIEGTLTAIAQSRIPSN